MTLTTLSKTNNDCVIVALSNHFNIPYDDVMNEIVNNVLGWKWNGQGVPQMVWSAFLRKRGYVPQPVPRRGQSFMTGIIVLRNTNKTKSHMAIVLNGIVYDNSRPEGQDIKSYRETHMVNHVSGYWVR